MGLFSKKKQAPQKDFDILSGAGLVDFVKSNLKNPTDKNVAKAIRAIAEPDKDQKHLTKDGELPWGWLRLHTPICEPYEDAIVKMAVDLKGSVGSDRIRRLEHLIDAYYIYKNFCYSKDECFIKYFSDKWEHCHNSRCDDFEYITRFEEELKVLKHEVQA